MSVDQFYLVLPSNSSLNYFPQNSLASYITKLAQPLELPGRWEAGLSEIQFKKSWFNVREGEQWIYYRRGPRDMFNAHQIPIGHYSTIQELIGTIQSVIDEVDSNRNVILSYDGIMNRVRIAVKNGGAISMKDDLATMLGCESPLPSPITTSLSTPYSPDVQLGIYSLYVYSDLLEAQAVGDSRVPLLRIIPVQGSHGEFITKTYERPQYFPVQKSRVDTVQVDIRDDTGELIHFESGKVVVTIHFRLATPSQLT